MYNLLILLVIVGFVNSHYHHHHHKEGSCTGHGHKHLRKHNHHHHRNNLNLTNDIEYIKRNFIDAETAFNKYCTENINSVTEELYGSERYFLKYRLPEAKNAKVTVQITHRFIHTTVEKNGGIQILNDIRLLPGFVKVDEAAWTVGTAGIEISFTYKVPIGTLSEKNCEVINSNIINVPAVVYSPLVLRNKEDASEIDPQKN